MALLQAIARWFSSPEPVRTRFEQTDFGDSILPSHTSVIGNRTRDSYVAHGPDDETTLKAIRRYISIASVGKSMSKDQLQKQAAMGAMVTSYARGSFPAAHEFSLSITRGPLAIRYTLHHYDSNKRLIHELTLEVER